MAQNSAHVAVATDAPALLWQTTTAVAPDPITTAQGNATDQIFFAGTPTDPLPIVIRNLDATNSVYLGGVDVDSSTGMELKAGESLTRNVVGNDSEYAIAVGGTVDVAVEVGRQ